MSTAGTILGLAAGLSLIALATAAYAEQPQMAAASDSEYIAKAMSAAPEQVAKDATIVAMGEDGSMRMLRKGSNEFTCMILGNDPMCMDKNATEWGNALMTHQAPPDKVGFMYMLRGDSGASNTDPYATGPQPDNHWIKTGSHVMIIGPVAKTMEGYPRTPDPDPTKPYVMWAGTPYEHLMIPVK